MRYLLKYLLFESKNQEIFTLLKNNQGYYNIFDKFHKDGISIQRLSQLIDRIRQDRNIIKVNLLQFKTIEEIDDYLTKIEEDSKYIKVLDQLSNQYNHLLDDKVKSLLYEYRSDIQLLKVFFKKIKVYKSADDFYSSLDNFIKNNKGEFNLKRVLPKVKEPSQVIHKDESLLIVRVSTFSQSQELGSANWCISRNISYFDQYSNNRYQFFIWDFTQPSHSKYSQIGVTINKNHSIYTAHFKDDSRCDNKYILDNFGDQLSILDAIADDIINGKESNQGMILTVLNSQKVSKEKKEKILSSKGLVNLIKNSDILDSIYKNGFVIDGSKFDRDTIKNILITPNLFQNIYKKGIKFDIEGTLKSMFDSSDISLKRNLINIGINMLYLSQEGENISKYMKYIYLNLDGNVCHRLVSKCINDYKIDDLNFDIREVNSYSLSWYSGETLDKLLDILLSKNIISTYVLNSVSKEKYKQMVDKYKNANYNNVPSNMIPLINVETLISDFNFKFGGKKEVNFVVLHRLLSSKDKDYEIFEKFKEKNSKAYDSIVSNLSSYEDVVSSKVDGVYIYDVTNEIIEKLSKHKGSSILDVGNNKLMKMISKPEISDTFEDDILKFYDTFCADMSVAEVIRSEYFVNIKEDVDTLNIQLPKRWPSNFSFNIPLSEFYEAWEKSKETYMDYLSYDIWSAFKVSFEETFGFRKNLKTDQYTFDFVIRGRELFINPFKLWALQQLWEVDMDSYSFTNYILYYFGIRDYNMIKWDDIEFGDSLSYIMERPIIKICSKYRNLSKSE